MCLSPSFMRRPSFFLSLSFFFFFLRYGVCFCLFPTLSFSFLLSPFSFPFSYPLFFSFPFFFLLPPPYLLPLPTEFFPKMFPHLPLRPSRSLPPTPIFLLTPRGCLSLYPCFASRFFLFLLFFPFFFLLLYLEYFWGQHILFFLFLFFLSLFFFFSLFLFFLTLNSPFSPYLSSLPNRSPKMNESFSTIPSPFFCQSPSLKMSFPFAPATISFEVIYIYIYIYCFNIFPLLFSFFSFFPSLPHHLLLSPEFIPIFKRIFWSQEYYYHYIFVCWLLPCFVFFSFVPLFWFIVVCGLFLFLLTSFFLFFSFLISFFSLFFSFLFSFFFLLSHILSCFLSIGSQ